MSRLGTPACSRLVAVLLLCAGCAPDAQSTAAGAGGPVWPGDEWPVSTPGAEGLDPAAIDALISDIDAGRSSQDRILPAMGN